MSFSSCNQNMLLLSDYKTNMCQVHEKYERLFSDNRSYTTVVAKYLKLPHLVFIHVYNRKAFASKL